MVRTIFSVVALLCLALLCGLVYLGRCPPEAIPLYLAAWAAPGLLDRQRGALAPGVAPLGPELVRQLRALEAQPVPVRARTVPEPVPEVVSEDLKTAPYPPPLPSAAPETVREFGAAIQVAADHPDERTRRLHADRVAAAARILQKAGGAVLLLHLAGCAHLAADLWPPRLACLALGGLGLALGALGCVAAARAQLRLRDGALCGVLAALLGMLVEIMAGCSPVIASRYRTALAACEMGVLTEAPAGIQDAVSRALHLPADRDWRGALQDAALDFGARIGMKAAGCLVDAEVLRYAFAEGGVSSSHKALTVEGRAASPDELARARAVEWAGRGQ